jgi:Domain of unknown function (DUF892)
VGSTAMGFFSKDIKTMDDLFVHTLRVIYYAEKQIVQALPEMVNKSNDPQLNSPHSWIVQPSMALSTTPKRSPARSRTNRFWMPRSSPRRKRGCAASLLHL